MIWIALTLWVLIGIYAFYLELASTPKYQVQEYFDDNKLGLLVLFLMYCSIGIVILLFSWLDGNSNNDYKGI